MEAVQLKSAEPDSPAAENLYVSIKIKAERDPTGLYSLFHVDLSLVPLQYSLSLTFQPR